ncbi:Multidomain signal transduction protein including CheB-like methylesterase, CheR-like methyltransferase and BaeS-like histidine kinase [Methylomonas fluvii]|nr:Multidomain signal transduction protein including CheB-like methylesterase, CheR-like methyltransferase and BaeS-like histidine kinase [Methylomonas fluvii]
MIKDRLTKFFDKLRVNQERNRHVERFRQIRFQQIPIHLTSVLSVATPIAAGLLQWSLWSALSPLTWILFYPAVFLSAYLGGLLSGLLATAIAVSMGIYIFVPPVGSFNLAEVRYYYSTAIFALMGLSFNLAFEQLRRSKTELQRIASVESDVNHRRLHQALRAANAGIWEWNLQTNENQWDEGLWRLYGLEPFSCQACYDVWLSTVHPADRAMVQAAIHQAVQQNIELNVEWRLATQVNGRDRWLMSRDQPELDQQGQPILYRGIVVDITARKLTEKALQTSEKQFRLLAESMPQIVWITRADGWHVYFNRQWVEYTGLSLAQSVGEGWTIPLHPDDKPQAVQAWKNAVDELATYSQECRLRRSDGVYRWWLIRGVPVFADNGRIDKWFGTCTDIHDLKQAELDLRTSEARWQFALEGSNQGVWDWNIAESKVFFSHCWKSMLGYAEEDVGDSLHDWSDRVHPDDLPGALAAIQRHFRQETPHYQYEHRLRDRRGEYRWTLARGVVVSRDADGQPLRMIGIQSDISESRKIEHDLREKERLLADSQAVAHIGSWVRYLPGGQAMWSEETFRVFGLSPDTDQALSMEQLFDTVHPDDRAARLAWHQDCLAGNSGNGLEYRICTPQGQQRWVLSKAKLETTADGQPWRLIGTVQDITEAKLTAAEKQRWIDAFRYCGHGIAIGNPETGRLVTCNPAFAEMLGYDNADQFEGQLILSLYAPEHVEFARRRLHEADQFGKIRYESVYRRKDGSEFDVAVDLVSVKNAEQKVMYRAATVQDISVRKKQEMELLQYRDHLQNLVEQRTEQLNQALQRAEHLTQVKSSFVANMSHEIRTPMNAVLGFCYLLEQHALNEEERSLVRKIRDAGRSLLAIINDILDFSKIEVGRLEIENLPFRLSDMFDHLAALMAAAADHKNLELIIIPPASIDALMGDGLRIQQVLINLIGNAIKFTERGEVVLRVTVDDWQNGDTVAVRFAVRDTGIGIAEPQLDDVFAAFTQADNTISRRFGGSGLGLAICRQLVNLMGGELRVNSVAGQGSEFWFVLRLQRHLDGNPVQSLPHLHHLKLLVVDDCETTREAVNTSARSLDWNANAVASGDAAIVELLASLERAEPYDALLLDWPMPGVDGMSAAEAIRASLAAVNPDQPRIAIILMISSSYSRELLAADADMKHVEGILSKPVTPSALYNAVAAVLSKSPPLLGLPDKSSNSAGARLQGLRILVVDDSDINREVARRILESEGAQVSLASDGQDAVDWLFKHPGAADLVLMDVQMPRMDGYAATRRIRENPAWSDLPILALTAGAFKNLQDAALEAGMNDFIAKPFNVPQMLELIRRWTGSKSLLGLTGLASGDSCDEVIFSDQSAPLIVPTNPGQGDLPGIDVNAGLKMWHKRDLYQAYLVRFVEQYRTAGRDISVAAEQGQLAGLAALTHKLKGAAYGLALTEVAQRSAELETALHHSEPLAGAAAALQQALDVVIISIGNLSAHTMSPLDHSVQREAPDSIKPLLSELLTALDEDNPGHAERLLLTLEGLVDADLLAPLATQIRDYNFRQAESLVLALINQLEIPKQ